MVGISSTRDSRRRVRARIAFILVLLLAVLLFFLTRGDGKLFSNLRSSIEDPSSQVMTIIAHPVRLFESFMAEQKQKAIAHEENIRLRQELSELRDIETRANTAILKLERLEAILNVNAVDEMSFDKIAARAVTENGGPFVRSMLINAGQQQGVVKGHAVMTADGLLGHVSRAGKSSSRVLMLQDLNSRVPVMSLRSRERAILAGDNTAYPKLTFVEEGADWNVEDKIVTSGDDGILPMGLPVGILKQKEESGFYVELYSEKNHIDWVWTYPFVPIETPQDIDIDQASNFDQDNASAPSQSSDEALLPVAPSGSPEDGTLFGTQTQNGAQTQSGAQTGAQSGVEGQEIGAQDRPTQTVPQNRPN